jgi:hypothetical protein
MDGPREEAEVRVGLAVKAVAVPVIKEVMVKALTGAMGQATRNQTIRSTKTISIIIGPDRTKISNGTVTNSNREYLSRHKMRLPLHLPLRLQMLLSLVRGEQILRTKRYAAC